MNQTPPGLRESALILVIERDPHVRELQRYFLEQAGFTVEFAENGSVAVDQARERLPTILISEILVPGLDGLSVCRTLKADRRTRAITVLIFSILAARERALEAGADAFLKKPLNDETLVQTVEMLLLQPAKGGAAHGTH